MKGKTIRVRIADLKRHRVRTKKRSPEELKALALSYLETPYHPILCSPDMMVGDGNGRLDGLELLGETETDVFVLEEAQDEKSLIKMGFVTAYFREGLSLYDQALAIKSYKEADPDAPNKDVAKDFRVDPAKVTRATSLFSCIPEVIGAAMAGQIGEADWYAISKRKPEDQLGLLAFKRSGASSDELERQGRKKQTEQEVPDTPSEKTVRIRIPLAISTKEMAANGMVTVAGPTGKEIDWSEAENLLRAALQAVKEAKGRCLGLKAAQASWKDMAAPKAKGGA